MPVVIASQLNRPVVSTFTPTEFGSRDPGAGVNISLDNGQAFIFRGINASFVMGFPDEYDRVNLFRVYGFENQKLQYDTAVGTSLIAQNPSQNYIYRFDQPVVSNTVGGTLVNGNRVAEYFSTPIIYDSYTHMSFAADLRRGGSVVALAQSMQIYIEIIGEIVNKNDKTFPYQWR